MIETALISALDMLGHEEFDKAVGLLGDDWPGLGMRPSQNGLEDNAFARLLTICGVLTMKLGVRTLENVGDTARDMLSEAVRLFGSSAEGVIVEVWIGTSYVDEGQFNEAIAWFDTVLDRKNAEIDATFLATLNRSIAEMRLGRVADGLKSLESIRSLLPVVPHLLRGKFYLQIGVGCRRQMDLDRALDSYGYAEENFIVAKSPRFATMVMNNIAWVYLAQKNYRRAHVFARKALSQIRVLGDRGFEAQILDTTAQIYVREGKFDLAVTFAQQSVEILGNTEREAWLAESLITLGQAYAGLSAAHAFPALERAIQISQKLGNTSYENQASRELWRVVTRTKEAAQNISDGIQPLETLIIERTLEKNDGAITATAKELGFKHHQLLTSRLQRLKLTEKRQAPVKRKTAKSRKTLQGKKAS